MIDHKESSSKCSSQKNQFKISGMSRAEVSIKALKLVPLSRFYLDSNLSDGGFGDERNVSAVLTSCTERISALPVPPGGSRKK